MYFILVQVLGWILSLFCWPSTQSSVILGQRHKPFSHLHRWESNRWLLAPKNNFESQSFSILKNHYNYYYYLNINHVAHLALDRLLTKSIFHFFNLFQPRRIKILFHNDTTTLIRRIHACNKNNNVRRPQRKVYICIIFIHIMDL